MKKYKIIILFILFSPLLVFAESLIQSGDDVLVVLSNITTWLWRFFVIATIIAFLIAGFFYLTSAGDAKKVDRAHKMVQYGVMGVVVALLSGGMVALIQGFITP